MVWVSLQQLFARPSLFQRLNPPIPRSIIMIYPLILHHTIIDPACLPRSTHVLPPWFISLILLFTRLTFSSTPMKSSWSNSWYVDLQPWSMVSLLHDTTWVSILLIFWDYLSPYCKAAPHQFGLLTVYSHKTVTGPFFTVLSLVKSSATSSRWSN